MFAETSIAPTDAFFTSRTIARVAVLCSPTADATFVVVFIDRDRAGPNCIPHVIPKDGGEKRVSLPCVGIGHDLFKQRISLRIGEISTC
jgi:hypothetical protein